MKKKYNNKNIIGCDETGVGDYLTPLVAAAVFVPYQNIHKLIKIGTTDSKKISDNKIKQLAKMIKPLVIFQVRHLSQSGYNKLNHYLNANELKMFLHLAAINAIEEKISDVDLIIIDKFANENVINKYIKHLLSLKFNFKPLKTELELVFKGEMEHIAVAAASILARQKLLELMEHQNKKWNTIFPLGTNHIVEKFILDFVQKYGKNKLNEVVKLKFKTTNKLFG